MWEAKKDYEADKDDWVRELTRRKEVKLVEWSNIKFLQTIYFYEKKKKRSVQN